AFVAQDWPVRVRKVLHSCGLHVGERSHLPLKTGSAGACSLPLRRGRPSTALTHPPPAIGRHSCTPGETSVHAPRGTPGTDSVVCLQKHLPATSSDYWTITTPFFCTYSSHASSIFLIWAGSLGPRSRDSAGSVFRL